MNNKTLALSALFILTACGQPPESHTVNVCPNWGCEVPEVKKTCEEQGGRYGSFSGPTCSIVGTFCLNYDAETDVIYLDDKAYPSGTCGHDMVKPLFVKPTPNETETK